MTATSTSRKLLTALLPEWHLLLQGWASSGRLTAAAQEALLLNGEPQALKTLASQWSKGDFSAIPEIVLLSGESMNRAMGAYAISTGKIYLNQDWLATATKEQVVAVLNEELGHHLDVVLNAVDTPGDEGEYFARLLSGSTLSVAQKNSFRNQDDFTSVMINKSSVIAEGALVGNGLITVNGAALQVANHPTNKIQLLSVHHGFGSAWWNQSIDLSKDWSSSFYVTAFNGSGTSDGFTFAINGDSRGLNAIGDGGENLGFFGFDSKIGVSNSYAVLFDMWATGPSSLIGFAPSSTSPFNPSGVTVPVSLANNAYDVSISYVASTKKLSVTLGGQTFSQDIDLQATVGNKAYLGFTAANGGGTMDIDVANWDVTASEYITSPIIRNNSLYAKVSKPGGLFWTEAEDASKSIGGHLVTINDSVENQWIIDTFKIGAWIGFNQTGSNSGYRWSSGQDVTYTNWEQGLPDFPSWEFYAHIDPWGTWADSSNDGAGNILGDSRVGIAEVPITSSINFSPTAREGQTLITTIAINAGTQATGNLLEGALIYFKITGITAEDLDTTSPDGLTGSGTIVNGKLVLNHKLRINTSVENKNLKVSVFSDPVKTLEFQIGNTASVAIEDTRPVVRANSVYSTVVGPSWTQAETNAINLGGHLVTINSKNENNFIANAFESIASTREYFGNWIGMSDAAQEGVWKWSSGEPVSFTYWGGTEFGGIPDDAFGGQDYAALIFSSRGWDSLNPQPLVPTGAAQLEGIAEVPITSSISFSPTAREGQTLITTIALNAGTQATSNLAEGALIYFKITGITPDDLESTTPNGLTGSGSIVNGKLVLKHKLKIDSAIENENFQVSIYSDATRTAQFLIGSTASVAIQEADTTPPVISSITTQASTVILKFTKTVSAQSVPASAFSVATINSTNAVTNRTISSVSLDPTNATQVILTLTGTAPTSTVNLQVSYSDPFGDQTTGVIQDLSGNDADSFVKCADTFVATSTATIASQYLKLNLTGTGNINGTGNALNNTITGNAGNNILNGAVGADSMIGGLGNDIYVVDNTGDVVTEASNAGTDMVQSSISYTLGSNIENLTLTGTDPINGTGNSLNNTVIGNTGNNNLAGGAGNDILNGDLGADKMVGGAGDDVYVVDNTGDVVTEASNAGTDVVQSSISYALGANLENLTLTGSTAINGTGNSLNNTITGNTGNNILRGGTGVDVLTGLGSSDIFQFALADSRLGAVDRITDLAIGTDWIDGPSMVFAENIKHFGKVSSLTQEGIVATLTSSAFLRNQAATFTFGTSTYLALNDGTDAFNSISDGIIDLTGYSGSLNNLAIL